MVEQADYDSAKKAYDKTKGVADPVVRFRGLVDLQSRLRELKDEIDSERKKRDAVLRDLKDELVFFNRHKSRVAQLRHAMLKVYRNPDKAFRAFEALLGYYPKEEVLERITDNPFELGSLHGLDIVLMKSPPRDQAVENYEKMVMPAINQIIDDHIYFVRGQSTDWDKKIQDADKESTESNRLSGEIELLSTQAQMDQLQIAKDLDADNIARLKTPERRLVEWMKDKADRALARLKIAQKQAAARAGIAGDGDEQGDSKKDDEAAGL
ncbi:MAG: hypothetical protein NXI16_00105 [Alphaproteobacteria bacterium]|nr:hypothetical protein [Alphaproteobacteria bacterium]